MLVFRKIDDTHPTLAQFFNDSISGNRLADHARGDPSERERKKLENSDVTKNRNALQRGFTVKALCAKGHSNSSNTKNIRRVRESEGLRAKGKALFALRFRVICGCSCSYPSFVARIFASWSLRNACSLSRSSGRLLAKIAIANKAAFTAPGFPIASVPTGMPPGICTVASNESSPFKDSPFIAPPRTGSVVCAAKTPARCAAPPAAAITTSSPRNSAVDPNSAASDGERWAEMTRHS